MLVCAIISINAVGITQLSVKATPPDGEVSVKRNKKSLIVTILANPLKRGLPALGCTQREAQTIYYSIEDTEVLRILRLLSHIYDHDRVMRPRRHSSRRHSSYWHPPKKTRMGSDVAPMQGDQPR